MIHRKAALRSIYDSIRRMHQRNRTVASSYGSGLSLAETTILVELLARPDRTASELCAITGLNAVQMSRAVKRLGAAKLLSAKGAPDDSRRKLLALTPAGKRRAGEVVEWGMRTFGAAYARLAERERALFGGYLEQFCDGLGPSSAARVHGDAPLMREIRRLTRAFGFVGDSAFGMRLTPLEWHILCAAAEPGEETFIQDLAERYSLSQATMAKTVQRMEARGLLIRVASSGDARRRPLGLSRAGARELEKLEDHVLDTFDRALRPLAARQVEEFARLWEKYRGADIGARQIVLGPLLSLQRAASEEERTEVRAFLVRERAAQGLLESLPPELASRDSHVFVLRRSNRILAVLECVPDESGDLRVSSLVAAPRLNPGDLDRFLRRALLEALRTTDAASARIESTQTSPSARRLLSGLAGSSAPWVVRQARLSL